MSEKSTKQALTLVSINTKLMEISELANINYNILLDVGSLHPSTSKGGETESLEKMEQKPVIETMDTLANTIRHRLLRNNEYLREIREWGGEING